MEQCKNIFVAIFCFISFLIAQEYGTITGRVTNAETGEPVIGASVTVDGTQIGNPTDTNGFYSIINIPTGIYNLIANDFGFILSRHDSIEIRSGCQVIMDFKLEPVKMSADVYYAVEPQPDSNQEYGFITGRVTNAETGEPLIGASISIMGTKLGIGTDEKGHYELSAPPGEHDIYVCYLGYNPVTFKSFIVATKQTKTLDITLKPMVITMPVMEPGCWPPMIKISETQSTYINRQEEISRLPITTLNDLVRLNPSVTETNAGMHIRGGDANVINYYIDGILTRIPNTGAPSINVPANVIDEMFTIYGGFNAENGGTNAALIKLTTRYPYDEKYFRYLTDRLFSSKKLDYGYSNYDLMLSGPLPVRKLKYLISGNLVTSKATQQAFYRTDSPGISHYISGKLLYMLPDYKGRVTFSGIQTREQYVFSLPPVEEHNAFKYLTNNAMSRTKNWIIAGKLQYMINRRTLTIVDIGVTHFDKVFGPRDYTWEEQNNRSWFDDYRLKYENMLKLLDNKRYPVHDILVDSIILNCEKNGYETLRRSPYAIDGFFYAIGDFPKWTCWNNYDFQLHPSMEHAFGMYHTFKCGFDLIKYYLKYYYRSFPPLARTNHEYRFYERQPYTLSGYFQDKIDVGALIANIGLRFDLFDPRFKDYGIPLYPWDDTLISVNKTVAFAPRIGFSLPITERQKLRFNYGHYYRIPPLDYYYDTSDTVVIRIALTQDGSVLSNIMLQPEKTVAYELGFENEISDFLLLAITAYEKETHNAIELHKIQALPFDYYQYQNTGIYDIKGIEIELIKRLVDIWGFGIAYNLQFARGISPWAHKSYYEVGVDPPAIDYDLDQDERHNIVSHFDLEIPNNFMIRFLNDITNSLVITFHSGHPYTPEDFTGNRLDNVNSLRMPGYLNVDWKLSKAVKTHPGNLVFSCLVNNLLNTKQIIYVYPTTGSPEDHGDYEPPITQFEALSMVSLYYSPQGDYNHDGLTTPHELKDEYVAALKDYYTDPTSYRSPFRLKLSIGIEF